jgi:hypothetical protein
MKADKSTSSDNLAAINFLENSGALTDEDTFKLGQSKGLAATPQMLYRKMMTEHIENSPLFKPQYAKDDAQSQQDFDAMANDKSMSSNKAFQAIKRAYSRGGKFDAKGYADDLNNPDKFKKKIKDAGYAGDTDSDEFSETNKQLASDATARQGVTAKVRDMVNQKAPADGGDDFLKKISDALNGLGGSGGALTKIGNALQSLTG